MSFVDNLRAKPEEYRRRFAFWASVGVTAIIFLFWIASMTGVTATAGNAVVQAVQKAGTPASSLVAGVGALFSDIKDLIFTPKKVTYTSIEVKPGK